MSVRAFPTRPLVPQRATPETHCEVALDCLSDPFGPSYTPAWASLRRLWHIACSVHSPWAPSKPRSRRKPAVVGPSSGRRLVRRWLCVWRSRPPLFGPQRPPHVLFAVASFGIGPLGAAGTCSSCLMRPVAINTSTSACGLGHVLLGEVAGVGHVRAGFSSMPAAPRLVSVASIISINCWRRPPGWTPSGPR